VREGEESKNEDDGESHAATGWGARKYRFHVLQTSETDRSVVIHFPTSLYLSCTVQIPRSLKKPAYLTQIVFVPLLHK